MSRLVGFLFEAAGGMARVDACGRLRLEVDRYLLSLVTGECSPERVVKKGLRVGGQYMPVWVRLEMWGEEAAVKFNMWGGRN
jgi:hypothetical protein